MTASTGRPAFADVAEANLDAVHRYLVHLVGDRHLADDLTSATFERALRDAGPPAPRTFREMRLLVELAGRHPQLFPDGPGSARRGGDGPADAEVWAWIGAAVPDGLRAIASEAGLDARRVSRDLATAIVGA